MEPTVILNNMLVLRDKLKAYLGVQWTEEQVFWAARIEVYRRILEKRELSEEEKLIFKTF